MIVEPKVKGFICTTAHPVGCEANVNCQIKYVKEKGKVDILRKYLLLVLPPVMDLHPELWQHLVWVQLPLE